MRNTILTLVLLGQIVLSPQNVICQAISRSDSLGYQDQKAANGTIRILTYNVRNCKGMDDKTDYGRIAKVIANIQPDVVALQELDSVTTRSNGVDVLKVLAGKCGMHAVFGPAIAYQGGKYGIGILSKEMPISTSFLSLPGREEKRGLLMAEFKDFLLLCSHFSLTEADRISSATLINQKGKEYNKAVFLAGDLNASPGSTVISMLATCWTNLSGTLPTFPSGEPTQCIDYIWGYKYQNISYHVVKQMVVPEKMASDHRPVFVDVMIR